MATDTDAKSVHNTLSGSALKFTQLTITRDVSVGSNLAEGFAVLAVALTNGG